MAIEIFGIDAEKGLDIHDNDEDFYLSVLRVYASKIPVILDKLRNVSAETLSNYGITMHSLKGTSETIGAKEIGKTAAELEAMAHAGNISGVLAKNEAFLKHADNVVNSIKDWLSRHDAKG